MDVDYLLLLFQCVLFPKLYFVYFKTICLYDINCVYYFLGFIRHFMLFLLNVLCICLNMYGIFHTAVYFLCSPYLIQYFHHVCPTYVLQSCRFNVHTCIPICRSTDLYTSSLAFLAFVSFILLCPCRRSMAYQHFVCGGQPSPGVYSTYKYIE